MPHDPLIGAAVPAGAADPNRLRRVLASVPPRRLALLAVVAAGLALAVWGGFKAIDPAALGAAFSAVSWPWVVASAAAYIAYQLASATAWGVGLAAGGLAAIERRHVLSAHWIGRGASELLPASLGEGVRLAALRRHPVAAAGGCWRIAGSMGAWKVLDGMVSFVVVMIATMALPLPDAAQGLRWVALGLLLASVVFFASVWRFRAWRLVRFLPGALRRPLESAAQGAALLTSRRDAATAVGLQLVAIAGRVISIAALLHAFGMPASAALLVFSLMVISGMVPISPGGVGVREAALVPALVATYGLGSELALAFSLGVQATALAVSLAGGLTALVVQRFWGPAAAPG